ncbi:hypothetical protein ACHQM5_007080 [Ranunculus cassubicifolius]
MGSESSPPPNLTDEEKSPDPEPVSERKTSPPSVFVNSEPIREDQVQNAVNFLSHPKVKGSPVMYRRSFLEKKGLSKEEIDEAFRRVPDPAPTATTTPAINQNQDGQVKSATNLQQTSQSSQPAGAGPTGVVSTIMRPARFHWSYAFYAIGILAASGAGTVLLFKKSIIPRLKSWIRKVVLEEENDSVKKLDAKPSLVEEAAAAAKSAAAAAADVARASHDILNSKMDDRRYFESFRNSLDVQAEEMKAMKNSLRKLEVTKEVAVSSSYKYTEEPPKSAPTSVWPPSVTAPVEPTVAPHPKSYMEIMAMVQRGEKPPGIKEINDLPPNPNQPPSNPRLAPRIKPWETSQGQNGSTYQTTESSSNSMTQDYFPSTQPNGDYSSDPWMQRRNARISEIEPETGSQAPPPYRTISNDRMNQRAWVPPQPPPIAMPEAAAAIRKPKSAIPIEQSNGDQLTSQPSNGFDELQRITKIAESGGEVEISEVDAVPRVTEIEEEL